jgi:membrane fusion protein (multidrug efflux system)
MDQLRVGVRLPDGSMLDGAGRLEFINVTTERATDSVLVQALVPNPQRLLADGQAVTAVVQAARPEEAIVVPQSALQVDQAGAFVLVVGRDNKVEVKRIGTRRGPAGQMVVTEGLEVGQLVITEGSQRARPGAAVSPRPAEAPPAGAVPAGAVPPPDGARPG